MSCNLFNHIFVYIISINLLIEDLIYTQSQSIVVDNIILVTIKNMGYRPAYLILY
jgi:hypothetical protein